MNKYFLINTDKKFFYVVLIFYFFFYMDYIKNGGIIYDDWSLATGFLSYNFLERLNVFVLEFFNTRPIGGIYAAIITSLGKNDLAYIFINSSLWLFSSAFIYFSLSKLFSIQSSIIFLLVSIFPSFASTPFFSPVTQSLGVFSIFLWSLSIFFAAKNKTKLTIVFFIMSILTYETSIVLFLFNIYFLSLNNNLDNQKYLIKRFARYLILFIILIFIIIIFQFLIAGITNNPAPLKYAFKFIDNSIVFEENFFENIKIYLYKPFSLILIEIPVLFFSSISFTVLELHNLMIYILICCILFLIFKLDNSRANKIKKYNFLFLIILLCSTFAVFLMYLIASSVPQINGYYNRGMVGLFFIFTFFVCWLNELNFGIFFNKIKFMILSLLLILNLNSMLIQKDNFVKTEEVRQSILFDVKKFSENKDNLYLLMIVPTYLDKNYNDETIFSREVDDIFYAVKYVTKNKVKAKRIFYSSKCSDIIKIENDILYGNIPSRSRKDPGMKKNVMLNKDEFLQKNIYVYFNDKFFKLNKNNQENLKVLSTQLGCTV